MGFLLALSFCAAGFFCANAEEPAFSHKQLMLDRIQTTCPELFSPIPSNMTGAIVKPAHASSVKTGVKLGQWSVAECEFFLHVPCMHQFYHPGPFEVRLYKSGQWEPTVSWMAKRAETEETNMLLNFSWTKSLQNCIDVALPFTPFLAVDIRSNGTDIQLLEVNGVAGMPFLWTTGESSMPNELFSWVWSRYKAGLGQLQWDKVIKFVFLLFQRQHVRGEAIRVPRQRDVLF
jgi:hypothetical protein